MITVTTNIRHFVRTHVGHFPKLIALMVLGLSWMISFSFGPDRLLVILGGILVVSMVILFLRWPPLGLLMLIAVSYLFRKGLQVSGGTSLNPTTLLLALLIGLWLLDMIARQRKVQLVFSRSIAALLVFCFVSLLSLLIGQLPWIRFGQHAPIAAQLIGLAITWLSAGAFLLSAHQLDDLRWLNLMTWIIVVLSGLYIGGVLLFGDRFYSVIPPPGSTLFYIWTVALAFSQALLNRNLRLWQRALLAGVVLATILTLSKSYKWRSGWLPSLVTIATILLIRYPRLTPPLILGGIFVSSNLLPQIITQDQYSFDTRIIAAQIILEKIVVVNPIFGLGPANYYYYAPLFPILGYAVVFNSHNNYIDIIAQTGFLGLFCFLWFAVEIWRLGWRLRKVVPEGFNQAYVYGVLGGLVGTLFSGLLGDWFLPFVYNIGLDGLRSTVLGWLVLGGLVALGVTYEGHASMGVANK